MDDFHENREAGLNRGGGAACRLPARLLELLALLVADVASDVEVVARELGLRDQIRELLRRALDRVDCAQGVLEAMREVGLVLSEQSGPSGKLPWSGQLKQSRRLKQSERVTEEVSAEGGWCGGGGDTGGSHDHSTDDASDVMQRVRGVVELLAEKWPQDYPLGAVEWLILGAMERSAPSIERSSGDLRNESRGKQLLTGEAFLTEKRGKFVRREGVETPPKSTKYDNF